MIFSLKKLLPLLLAACFVMTAGCSIFPDFSPGTNINTSQLGRVLAQNPNNIHALFMAGRASLENKDYKQAADYFNQAIDLQEDFEEAWKGLSLAYLNRQDFQGAKNSMEELSLRFPERSVPYEGLAAAWLGEGRYDECELNAKKALDRDPQSAVACLYLGEVAYSRGHYSESVKWWGQAIEISPKLKSRVNPLYKDLKQYNEKYH